MPAFAVVAPCSGCARMACANARGRAGRRDDTARGIHEELAMEKGNPGDRLARANRAATPLPDFAALARNTPSSRVGVLARRIEGACPRSLSREEHPSIRPSTSSGLLRVRSIGRPRHGGAAERSRRRAETADREFPKITINSGKFTGFFDKLLKIGFVESGRIIIPLQDIPKVIL